MGRSDSQPAIAAIILCAGKGRRMLAPRTPKVCTPVGGKPAIIRLLECQACFHFDPTVLVVGHLAKAVRDEVSPAFPHVEFVNQNRQLGTGHAARKGARLLAARRFGGAVLVMAGDKVVEPRALRKLIAGFQAIRPDLAVLVTPIGASPSAGRVVTDSAGQILRIIETVDLRNAESENRGFNIGGEELSARDVEKQITWENQGIYLFQANALYQSLDNLGRDNVQGEEYLTDTVGYLSRSGGRVIPIPTDDPGDVLGFNDPVELLQIEEQLHRRTGTSVNLTQPLDRSSFRPPAQWARLLRERSPAVQRLLREIYGNDVSLCEEKRKRLLRTVDLFINHFGTTGQVAVVRSPGRLNVMGRHIDHRGGCVNLVAIDREQFLVARPREDSVVRARNADAVRFPDLEFSVDGLLRQVRLDDWGDFVSNATVVAMVRDLRGDWGNYLKAPLLRLQQEFRDRRIRGLDCVVGGDIPMAAGLSSSSALVVAMAEALVLANGLDVTAQEFINVCGEGEWFVGTRGGKGDHAGIKLSQPGQVTQMEFFPFNVRGYADFPKDHAMVVFDSRIEARKSAEALDAFNERIASFELGMGIIRKRFPRFADRIEHLRDISPARLGVEPADIYRLLMEVPETATPRQLCDELGHDVFESVTSNHGPRSVYSLRARLLYGIAECERSRLCLKLLQDGRMQDVGGLMVVSHAGDRVVGHDGQPNSFSVGDLFINARVQDLCSPDPRRRAAAQLWLQPGAYACSVPQVDRMVDTALATPGVLGAQLAGAGFGGCMMALARAEAAQDAIQRMDEFYYGPENLEPAARIVTPIAGCSALRIDDEFNAAGPT